MRRASIAGVGCLALVALLCGLARPAPAQAVGPVLNHCIFTWSEAVVPGNDLSGFNIYLATVATGPWTKIGTVLAPSPSGGANYVSPDLCPGIAEGQKQAFVVAVDLALNESPRSAILPFVLDVTAPPAVSNFAVR